ncbi:MAG: 5-formyltetrahydrofolate cyclo-ligase [Kiritimatiellales bacterium]
MKKAEIRKHIAALRPDFQTLEKMSAAVVKKFQTLENFQTAKAVGVYMPLPDEVNITPIFQTLETNCVGAQSFFIPAFDEAIGTYRMARLTTELRKGRFGIPEPVNPVFAAKDELNLILVPGVAFDRAGRRIGRGGGFYDRLLPQYDAVRAGLCFDFQCLETVPAEAHDIRMDWLITETKILKFAMNS